MREYKPSNKIGILGLPMLFIAALLSGIAIGGLAFFISFQFNLFLICIFPLIMGFLGGAFMIAAVKVGKVRSPLIAAIFGLLAGIAIVGVFRGAEYYFTVIHEDALRIAGRQNREATDEEVLLQSIPIGLERVDGEEFIEFNKLLAEFGTSISYRSTEIELNETMTWALWGIEALAIVIICIFMPFGTASEPFNENANRWYSNWEWFGSVPWHKRNEFLDLLKQGNFQAAGALITKGTLPLPHVDVDLTGDDTDSNSDWLLKINDVKASRNGSERSQVRVGIVSQSELNAMRTNVSEAAKPQSF
jgi:hypothetical protein